MEELAEHIAALQSLAQTQASQSGASAEKAQAFQALVDAAFEAAAATENLASPADYGITQAKLTALRKKMESFQSAQAKRATSSSATKELAKLFTEVDVLLNDRLDGLAVQFKDTQADFYNAYTTARSVVTASGGRSTRSTVVTVAPLVEGGLNFDPTAAIGMAAE